MVQRLVVCYSSSRYACLMQHTPYSHLEAFQARQSCILPQQLHHFQKHTCQSQLVSHSIFLGVTFASRTSTIACTTCVALDAVIDSSNDSRQNQNGGGPSRLGSSSVKPTENTGATLWYRLFFHTNIISWLKALKLHPRGGTAPSLKACMTHGNCLYIIVINIPYIRDYYTLIRKNIPSTVHSRILFGMFWWYYLFAFALSCNHTVKLVWLCYLVGVIHTLLADTGINHRSWVMYRGNLLACGWLSLKPYCWDYFCMDFCFFFMWVHTNNCESTFR